MIMLWRNVCFFVVVIIAVAFFVVVFEWFPIDDVKALKHYRREKLMMNVLLQGKGIGTTIIQKLCDYCKAQGYERIELAWVKGNPQSERFWKKNGFIPIGERSSNAAEHVIAAERKL